MKSLHGKPLLEGFRCPLAKKCPNIKGQCSVLRHCKYKKHQILDVNSIKSLYSDDMNRFNRLLKKMNSERITANPYLWWCQNSSCRNKNNGQPTINLKCKNKNKCSFCNWKVCTKCGAEAHEGIY